jgi:hypothetical protein
MPNGLGACSLAAGYPDVEHETLCVGKGLVQSLHDIQRLPNDGSRIALLRRIMISNWMQEHAGNLVGCEGLM